MYRNLIHLSKRGVRLVVIATVLALFGLTGTALADHDEDSTNICETVPQVCEITSTFDQTMITLEATEDFIIGEGPPGVEEIVIQRANGILAGGCSVLMDRPSRASRDVVSVEAQFSCPSPQTAIGILLRLSVKASGGWQPVGTIGTAFDRNSRTSGFATSQTVCTAGTNRPYRGTAIAFASNGEVIGQTGAGFRVRCPTTTEIVSDI